jgi:hypothetical protein
MPRAIIVSEDELRRPFAHSHELEAKIKENLKRIGYDSKG